MKRIVIHLDKQTHTPGLAFPVYALGCMPWAAAQPSKLTHPTVDFCLVLAGEPAWWRGACDDVEYRVRIPFLKIHIPGRVYDNFTTGMSEGVYFAYDLALLSAFRRAFPGFDEQPCHSIIVSPLMEMLLKQVEQLAQESHLPGVADRLDLCAMQLIAEAFAGSGGAADSPELITRKIASWLEVHFMEPDCAQWRALPRKYGVSYRSFMRYWHKIYNRTPRQFIGDLRAQAGRRLLETSDLSVQEIARSVGIDDQYYFSRMFKRNLGFSPAAWRRKHAPAHAALPPA